MKNLDHLLSLILILTETLLVEYFPSQIQFYQLRCDVMVCDNMFLKIFYRSFSNNFLLQFGLTSQVFSMRCSTFLEPRRRRSALIFAKGLKTQFWSFFVEI